MKIITLNSISTNATFSIPRLAMHLSKEKKKVLIVDANPQATLTNVILTQDKWSCEEISPKTTFTFDPSIDFCYSTLLEIMTNNNPEKTHLLHKTDHFDFLCGHIKTTECSFIISQSVRSGNIDIFYDNITKVFKEYDFVLIDCGIDLCSSLIGLFNIVSHHKVFTNVSGKEAFQYYTGIPAIIKRFNEFFFQQSIVHFNGLFFPQNNLPFVANRIPNRQSKCYLHAILYHALLDTRFDTIEKTIQEAYNTNNEILLALNEEDISKQILHLTYN
ncbi:MAG: ParA family protein [Crocinitomicaceae bacterium]|nr:ParA family protein [Crocinitomicaceae bacterium]